MHMCAKVLWLAFIRLNWVIAEDTMKWCYCCTILSLTHTRADAFISERTKSKNFRANEKQKHFSVDESTTKMKVQRASKQFNNSRTYNKNHQANVLVCCCAIVSHHHRYTQCTMYQIDFILCLINVTLFRVASGAKMISSVFRRINFTIYGIPWCSSNYRKTTPTKPISSISSLLLLNRYIASLWWQFFAVLYRLSNGRTARTS